MNPPSASHLSREEFESLALQVMDGTATAEDRARLQAAVTADPALCLELDEAAGAFGLLAGTAPGPVSAPVGDERSFHTFRRETRGAASAGGGPAKAPNVVQGDFSGAQRGIGHTSGPSSRKWPSGWLAVAACLTVVCGSSLFLLLNRNDGTGNVLVDNGGTSGGGPVDSAPLPPPPAPAPAAPRPDPAISPPPAAEELPGRAVATIAPALAPRGETAFTTPTMVWENEGERKYDVWVLPPEGVATEVPALFVASSVRSPLPFSAMKPGPASPPEAPAALEPDKPYRLLVCIASAGRHAGVTVPFRTSAGATSSSDTGSSDPAVILEKAGQRLAAGRPGDALMLLTTLTPEAAQSPEASALRAKAEAALPPAESK